MAGIVARNYARALFQLASETEGSGLERIGGDLALVSAAVASEAGFRVFLASRLVARKAKKVFLRSVFDGAEGIVLTLLDLLVDRGRTGILGEIAEAFQSEASRARGRREVTLRSAFPLGEDSKRRIGAALESRYGGRVLLDVNLSPSLLAGVVAESGGEETGLTAKGALEALERKLTRSGNAHQPG
jgi:F-type H+-transporting ATPase subunit delta